MTSRADGKTDQELEAEAKQKAYEEQERLIEENRQAPVKPLSQVIRWAYRSKINESVYCMNGDGLNIPVYSGKFADQGPRVLQDAPPEAEFYTSFSGTMNFVKQTRDQWSQGL